MAQQEWERRGISGAEVRGCRMQEEFCVRYKRIYFSVDASSRKASRSVRSSCPCRCRREKNNYKLLLLHALRLWLSSKQKRQEGSASNPTKPKYLTSVYWSGTCHQSHTKRSDLPSLGFEKRSSKTPRRRDAVLSSRNESITRTWLALLSDMSQGGDVSALAFTASYLQ